jgi:predicted transcriptional regulator of viral defense system
MVDLASALWDIAREHDGYFSVMEAEQAGVSRIAVAQIARRGRLEHIARGLYRFPQWPHTGREQYHEALLWPSAHRRLPYALVSHDSALELYGLTDLNPAVVHVTIPPGLRIERTPPPHIRLHLDEVPLEDRSEYEGVPVVAVRRAIEDVAARYGVDLVHRATAEAYARRLLTAEDIKRLTARFGAVVAEPYHAT